MKHLNDILESIFDIENNADQTIIDSIHKFIKDNYEVKSYNIHNKLVDGKYVVDTKYNIIIKNEAASSLTNGLFRWGKVDGNFDCSFCKSLTSLEGAPEKVGKRFFCNNCNKLTSLEGAPKEVGGGFYCSHCFLLTSLDGAPKEVGGAFDCGYCKSLKTLKGAPKEVGGSFNCNFCNLLTSFKGIPDKTGGNFYCIGCTSIKDKTETIKSNIKGDIIQSIYI